MTSDPRIVYGAGCTWWGSIANAGKRNGLPCCPHCGGVLFEVSGIEKWDGAVNAYAAKTGRSDYPAQIAFGRGKCFPNYAELEHAFKASKASDPPPGR